MECQGVVRVLNAYTVSEISDQPPHPQSLVRKKSNFYEVKGFTKEC